jgi:hypothetical protein
VKRESVDEKKALYQQNVNKDKKRRTRKRRAKGGRVEISE